MKKCLATLKNLTAYVQVVAGPLKVRQDLFSSMRTEPIIRGYVSPSMCRLVNICFSSDCTIYPQMNLKLKMRILQAEIVSSTLSDQTVPSFPVVM